MKNRHIPQVRAFVFLCLFSFFFTSTFSQVGIGTTNPNPSALLDIDASTTVGGLLLPRVALSGTANAAPLSSHVAGMTVYNTATAGNVTPGYYYNDGGEWVRIAQASTPSNDWTTTGNAGTTTACFIGTTDDKELKIGTNNTNRFVFTTNGSLRSFANGSAGQPTYSWDSDPDIGMYRIGNNTLGLATNGSERVRIAPNGNVGIGTTANASQRLEVTGNLRLNGAFMPGNQAGTTDKILLSQGAGTAPVWGPGFLNTSQISNIGKYFVGPFNVNNGIFLTLTVTDPNMTADTSIAYNFIGDMPLGPKYGYDFILLAESRNGTVIFYITNYSGYNLTGLQIVYTAFYH